MAIHSSTPAWRTPWTEEPGRLQSTELQTIGHNWVTKCECTHIICIWLHVCLVGEWFKIICCCSVTKSCATLCNPTDCSTQGFPVPHHLPEFAQVDVHCIAEDIQPSHPVTRLKLLEAIKEGKAKKKKKTTGKAKAGGSKVSFEGQDGTEPLASL